MNKKQALIELYSQCLNSNYIDMTNETHQLKAKVFATDLGLKYKKIEALFEEAKNAYEQHQLEIEREAQRAKKNAEIEEKIKQLQKNAKLAFTAKGIYDSEIKVYRCEDGSVFGKENDKNEKYTNIEITVEAGKLDFYKYHPAKTVYTGASAGGISMGGFHTTEAHYTQKQYTSGKGSIELHYGKNSLIQVESITLAPEIASLFKRVPGYKKNFRNNTAICRNDNNESRMAWNVAMNTTDQKMRMEFTSLAIDESKIPLSQCEEIADIINGIIRNYFPAQDEEIYAQAIELSKTKDIEHLEKSIELFEYIKDYKDAKKYLGKIRPVYDNLVQEQKEQNIIQKEKKQKKKKKIFSIVAIIVCVCVVFGIFANFVIMPYVKYNDKYNDAVALMEEGKHEAAIVAFEEINGYRDSEDKLNECNAAFFDIKYNKVLSLIEEGKKLKAMRALSEFGSYREKDKYGYALGQIANKETIYAGGYHTVGLKSDGTVVATSVIKDHYVVDAGQSEVSDWKDIVAISAGDCHTVGLKSDGTVVAIGKNDYSQCNVSEWKNIVAISAGGYHTVGLQSDGTVIAVGSNSDDQCDVSGWKDIVAISAGGYHTVGLKSDGTVIAVGGDGWGQCDVSDWKDIVAISAGNCHTVGLKSDGTVVAVGYNYTDQINVSEWTDMVAISAGGSHTVGIKSDGTVVATERTKASIYTLNYGQYDVAEWTDIVAVSAGQYHTVGLKSDGTVIAIGYIDNGQCEVSDWKNIKVPGNK